MDKQEVIAKLKDYITVLEDDNTLLTNVRLGNSPGYNEVRAGDYVEHAKASENFDIDFDVDYIKPEQVDD